MEPKPYQNRSTRASVSPQRTVEQIPRHVYSAEQDNDKIKAGTSAWAILRARKGTAVPTRSNSTEADLPGQLHSGVSSPNGKRSPALLERDFTTHGNPGNLGCPFASVRALRKSRGSSSASILRSRQIQRNTLPTPPNDFVLDPIAAEFHASDYASSAPSVGAAASKCPIRFLDQHSPEEVAKYFENHKHEIPRSHEICVKRYQTNEESIRQLDAKYGNLVSMIQGLGMKHQPMLSTAEEEDTVGVGHDSLEKVQHWASACSDKLDPVTMNDEALDSSSETRTGHFDRDLKEIRVGESPSRPWGIHVPNAEGIASSPNTEENRTADIMPSVQRSRSHSSTQRKVSAVPEVRAAKCPFDYRTGKLRSTGSHTSAVPHSDVEQKSLAVEGSGSPVTKAFPKSSTKRHNKVKETKLVCTGPVFVGYSVEDASELMRCYYSSAALGSTTD